MKIKLPIELDLLIQKGMSLDKFLNSKNKLDRQKLLNVLSRDNINKGLYAFWWTGSETDLKEKAVNIHTTQGDVTIHWLKKDFPQCCFDKNRFPLYIGKTGNFQSRISQHLCLNTEDWERDKKGRLNKKTTSCQFRSGLEHLYNYRGLKKNLAIFQHITLSFEPIKYEKAGEGVKQRFYLEDLAIGYFKPWFNIDSER